jgi:hypothetical protein
VILPDGFLVVSDDVRYELGGKVSLVGIYGGDMIFSAPEMPEQLARVGLSLMLRWPRGGELFPVEVRIWQPMDGDEPSMRATLDPSTVPAVRDRPLDPDTAPAIFANFVLEAVPVRPGGAFVAKVAAGDHELTIGRLRVIHRPPPAAGQPGPEGEAEGKGPALRKRASSRKRQSKA